ncbi:MAG: hypothetical protein WCW27_01795 [Patescibacteria group bacterium]
MMNQEQRKTPYIIGGIVLFILLVFGIVVLYIFFPLPKPRIPMGAFYYSCKEVSTHNTIYEYRYCGDEACLFKDYDSSGNLIEDTSLKKITTKVTDCRRRTKLYFWLHVPEHFK